MITLVKDEDRNHVHVVSGKYNSKDINYNLIILCTKKLSLVSSYMTASLTNCKLLLASFYRKTIRYYKFEPNHFSIKE